MINLQKLHHLVRAVASITNEKNFVIVGSASVLLTSRHIPAKMLNTDEIDIFAPDSGDEEAFSLLVESIGKGSQFDKTFHYYADGVSSKTSIMPHDWLSRARLIENISMAGITVKVPDINDIALAKMCAWREKDIEWLREGVRALLITPSLMRERLSLLPDISTPREEMERRMLAVFAFGGAP